MASYYVWSGATGSANGTTWANAYTTLTLAFSGKAAGDVFYIAHDHAESTAGAVTLTAPGTRPNPSKVICVNRAGSVPPVSADRRATASVATTGANGLTINGYVHYDGVIFNQGSGAGGPDFNIQGATTGAWMRLDNCSIRMNNTGASTLWMAGGFGGATATYIEWNNTTMSWGGVSSFQLSCVLKWRNTPSALLGTMPTNLFTPASGKGGEVECIGVDLSALGSGKNIINSAGSAGSGAHKYKFIDCKLNAAVAVIDAAPQTHGGLEVDVVRASATGNFAVSCYRVSGTLTQETTIIRSGGASDGVTPLSWKVVTTANCTYSLPFECPVIAIWNDTTGSAKTATIEGIASALPTDAEVWVDVEYLGDASSPQGSFVNDGQADLLATAASQTTSTATWGGALTGKFKLGVTFTAQMKGWVYARVKCAKASSTFYIDPLATLT